MKMLPQISASWVMCKLKTWVLYRRNWVATRLNCNEGSEVAYFPNNDSTKHSCIGKMMIGNYKTHAYWNLIITDWNTVKFSIWNQKHLCKSNSFDSDLPILNMQLEGCSTNHLPRQNLLIRILYSLSVSKKLK